MDEQLPIGDEVRVGELDSLRNTRRAGGEGQHHGIGVVIKVGPLQAGRFAGDAELGEEVGEDEHALVGLDLRVGGRVEEDDLGLVHLGARVLGCCRIL